MRRPIALTLGDPAGIGGEIALRAWRALRRRETFFLIGDADHMAALGQRLEMPVLRIDAPERAAEAMESGLPVLHHPLPRPAPLSRPDPANASAVVAMIERGVALTRAGVAAALCTNPINKHELQRGAGFAFPGHTEFLAHLSGVARPVMMLVAPALRVVPVTIHLPLAAAPAALTPELLEATLRVTHAALVSDFGIPTPRIAVAGLNPHAGESGAMGGEEIAVIAPVLAGLRAEGFALQGPLSADTMFHPAARARYDAAVCMYHDQALIPIKTLDFAGGVNVTLGLPFVRTSPDHGTAYDIAPDFTADPTSLIAAIDLARATGETRAHRLEMLHGAPAAHGGEPGAPAAADTAPDVPGATATHELQGALARHDVPGALAERDAPGALADPEAPGAADALAALPPLRDVIAAHGLDARKALGQNFLLDLNLTSRIARRAGDLTACDVLEIGPGPGGLTRALLAAGARHVVAVERDPRCMPALAEIAAAEPGRLTALQGDALALDPAAHLRPPVRIVANLPYNIGTELLVRWLTPPVWPPFWTSLTLMFQREVADRIVAAPGSKSYGRLSLLAQWRTSPRIAFEIPARAFWPPPKVTSAVVHFERLEAPRFPADPATLSHVVALAFGQRRKMLRASLRPLGDVEALLVEAGIPPTQRAEQVSLEAFCRLARLVASRRR